MERLVAQHPSYVIARLPQVAGKAQNPHTLLNFLYSNVVNRVPFTVYKHATRNIVDVDDIVAIVRALLDNRQARKITVNIANSLNCEIPKLVAIMEQITGNPALTNIVDRGCSYEIDTTAISTIVDKLGIDFNHNYMERVIQKHYGKSQPQ
ncbi:NAD-dependent epimerase/dehydratase [Pusillimonas sp. T7-7]|nr:NAD-dependent epimerase/dehydratase [Pusillimonas sp. T7-7]AEC21727.1 NAD-dependent epimerase/dehydratase [Pusillimonas sp. T7-7]